MRNKIYLECIDILENADDYNYDEVKYAVNRLWGSDQATHHELNEANRILKLKRESGLNQARNVLSFINDHSLKEVQEAAETIFESPLCGKDEKGAAFEQLIAKTNQFKRIQLLLIGCTAFLLLYGIVRAFG